MKKTRKITLFVLLLSIICLIAACLCACSQEGNNENGETHTHSWGNYTSDGVTTHTRTCSDCDEKETENHAWNGGVITKAATCKETGVKTFTCAVCSETKTEILGLTDEHSWSKYAPVDNVNHCHSCTVCNKSVTEKHDWGNGTITKQPTYEETGIKTYTCSTCGHTKTETIDTLTAHTYGKWTSDGENTHTHVCSVCNKSETENHDWGNGTITKQPTCKETGVKTYICTVCGENKTETIEKTTAHTYGKWTSDGENTHTHICSVCDESETENHDWDKGTVTKQPTCKDTGIKTYTCTVCGETKTETIEKTTVHSFVKWTSDSETEHSRTCSVCEEKETEPHNITGDVCSDCGYRITPASITSVDNAEVDFANSNVSMLVHKTVNSLNLSNAVKVSANSSWKLYTADSTLVATKFANLKDGENNFLIVVSSTDGLYENTYTLSIYKSFEISVKYYDVYNSVIHTETADTGYLYTINYTPEITGYTFNYWKRNDELATEFVPYANNALIPDCTANDYMLSLDCVGGESAETSKAITFDSAFTLPVPVKTGHTFTGWYNGSTKITNNNGQSVNNSKFAAETELTAKWQINSYKLTVDYDSYSHGSVYGGGTYEYNSSRTVTAATKAGYTFTGWYNGETRLCSELSYSFSMPAENVTYTAKWCKVSAVSENTERGTVTALTGTYIAGSEITVTATPTQCNHIFTGWYIDDNLIAQDFDYTFNLPYENTTLTAKWCVVTLAVNNSSAGEVNTLSEKYKLGDKLPATAILYLGYTFDGWYNNDNNLVTTELSFKITTTKVDATYTAKYTLLEEMEIFNFSSSQTECEIIGLKDKNLTEIVIPDSVTSIGSYAFDGCSSLESITIPDSVTSIGIYAFYGCSSLESITIPDSVTSIDSSAFRNCSSLESITIPDSVTSIGESAFENCKSLKSVTIGNSVTSIGSYAFGNCSSLESITIPDSVTSIGYYAFGSCSSLESITIPDSVTSISDRAFSYCCNLTSITIPDSVTSIGYSAFFDCMGLTIYCEVTEKPSGWDSHWNYSNCPVVWDCKNKG